MLWHKQVKTELPVSQGNRTLTPRTLGPICAASHSVFKYSVVRTLLGLLEAPSARPAVPGRGLSTTMGGSSQSAPRRCSSCEARMADG